MKFKLHRDARHGVDQRAGGDNGDWWAGKLADVVDELPLSSEMTGRCFGKGLVGGFGGREEEGGYIEVGNAPADGGECSAAGDADKGRGKEGGGGFVGHCVRIELFGLTGGRLSS